VVRVGKGAVGRAGDLVVRVDECAVSPCERAEPGSEWATGDAITVPAASHEALRNLRDDKRSARRLDDPVFLGVSPLAVGPVGAAVREDELPKAPGARFDAPPPGQLSQALGGEGVTVYPDAVVDVTREPGNPVSVRAQARDRRRRLQDEPTLRGRGGHRHDGCGEGDQPNGDPGFHTSIVPLAQRPAIGGSEDGSSVASRFWSEIARLRGKDSNLDYLIQSQASYR
jgi:hypothetical protein